MVQECDRVRTDWLTIRTGYFVSGTRVGGEKT